MQAVAPTIEFTTDDIDEAIAQLQANDERLSTEAITRVLGVSQSYFYYGGREELKDYICQSINELGDRETQRRERFRGKILGHMNLKKRMSIASICTSLAVRFVARGAGKTPQPPAWLRELLDDMAEEGQLEWSEMYQAYQLPGWGRRARGGKFQGEVTVSRVAPTWSPREYEAQRERERRERAEKEKALVAQQRKERAEARAMIGNLKATKQTGIPVEEGVA